MRRKVYRVRRMLRKVLFFYRRMKRWHVPFEVRNTLANKTVRLSILLPVLVLAIYVVSRLSVSHKQPEILSQQETVSEAVSNMNTTIIGKVRENLVGGQDEQESTQSGGGSNENETRVGNPPKPDRPFPDLPVEPVEPPPFNEELGIRGNPTPPLHPQYKRSTQNPPASVEAMIQAVKAGVPDASQYFWRRGSDEFAEVSTVPSDWDVQNGSYELIFEGRGDGGTRRVVYRFTDGNSTDVVDYRVLPSDSGWFIDETLELEENSFEVQEFIRIKNQ